MPSRPKKYTTSSSSMASVASVASSENGDLARIHVTAELATSPNPRKCGFAPESPPQAWDHGESGRLNPACDCWVGLVGDGCRVWLGAGILYKILRNYL